MYIFNGMGAVNADKIQTIEIVPTTNKGYYKVMAFAGGNEFTLFAAKSLKAAEEYVEKMETVFRQYYVVTTTEEIGKTPTESDKRKREAADKLGEYLSGYLS